MAADSTEPAFDWGDAPEEESRPREGQSVPKSSPPISRGGATLALFAGLYAVWSIAWVIAIAALPDQPASSVLDAVMYQFGEFLALIATPLWLGATWILTQTGSGRGRVLVLVLGLIVLFPFPLVLPAVIG